MNKIAAYIESGVLEMYVMGVAGPEECAEVEQMAAQHPEIRKAIDEIGRSIEQYAAAHAVEPHATMKPLILAAIDYIDRLKGGETPGFPPILGEHSRVEDYKEWLDRPDMILPGDADQLHARLIGYTPEATTAIIWVKEATPYEVHDHEYERFLIVEGTCEIIVDNEVHVMGPGDYLQIPLHKGHIAKVTSKIPCKIILQRVAA